MTDAEARDRLAFDEYADDAARTIDHGCVVRYDVTWLAGIRKDWLALPVQEREMWWLIASKKIKPEAHA